MGGAACVIKMNERWVVGHQKNKELVKLSWLFIHYCTKIGFGLLKRPRASGINTYPPTQRHHLFRCHLGLDRPKPGLVP
jgi:hypothetical protein